MTWWQLVSVTFSIVAIGLGCYTLGRAHGEGIAAARYYERLGGRRP